MFKINNGCTLKIKFQKKRVKVKKLSSAMSSFIPITIISNLWYFVLGLNINSHIRKISDFDDRCQS